MMRTGRTKISVVVLLTPALLWIASGGWTQDSSGSPNASQAQVAQPSDGSVNWKGVGIGAGTVVANLAYVPAKLAYGILGGIGGAAGYALTGGNKQVSNSIWRSSLGGDYVLTPDMMTGKKPIYFSGPSTMAATPAASPDSLPQTNSMQSIPSASSSSPPAATMSPSASTPAVSENPPAAHPIDSGAGLVPPAGAGTPTSGARNPNYSYSGYNPSQPPRKSRLSDTSIE